MYRRARGRCRRRRRRRSRLPLYAFLLAVLSFTLAFTLPPEEKEQQPDRIAAVKPVGSLLELSPDPAPDAPGESAWNLILANLQNPLPEDYTPQARAGSPASSTSPGTTATWAGRLRRRSTGRACAWRSTWEHKKSPAG